MRFFVFLNNRINCESVVKKLNDTKRKDVEILAVYFKIYGRNLIRSDRFFVGKRLPK